jgi:hypothetical protein
MFFVPIPKSVVMRQRYSSTEWEGAYSSWAGIGTFTLAILCLSFLGGCTTTPEGKLTWGPKGFGVSSAYGPKKSNTQQIGKQKAFKRLRRAVEDHHTEFFKFISQVEVQEDSRTGKMALKASPK